MAKAPEAPEPAADKRRFVNRNPRLQAAAQIVDVLHRFEPAERPAVLAIVQMVMGSQPELEFAPPEQR